MFISYMSMNRMVEEKAAKDGDYRAVLEKNLRPLLSHGRGMADEELLSKLRRIGLDTDRERLRDTFPRFASAEKMAKAMIADATSPIPDIQIDWVWIAVTCLWERWQPELPNTEMVDEKMQAGYAALKECDSPKACRLWLEAWKAILGIMERGGIRSLDAFDDHFGGTQSVFNWVQDLETELHNAGLQEPHFFRERITLCETMIGRFFGGSVPIDNFRMALAQSHFELGDRETGDQLFRRGLAENPRHGWSWIAWSDCYWTFAAERNKDAARAERILKESLATPGVEDRSDILGRLAELYKETGRAEEAEGVQEEIERLLSQKKTTTAMRTAVAQVEPTLDFGGEELPGGPLPNRAKSLQSAGFVSADPFARQPKVGRNEPCPCGSGKKFKKCCGQRSTGGPSP